MQFLFQTMFVEILIGHYVAKKEFDQTGLACILL